MAERDSGTEEAGTPPQTYTNNIYNTATFTPPQAGDANFVPYNQLTQAQVLGWVYENGVNQTAVQAALDTNIANQVNPPVVNPPLPWVPAPTESASK